MIEIIEMSRRLYDRGWLASADGNLSFRKNADEILITPSGRPKAFIQESELAVITPDNQILKGNPSGERLMHLEVYKKCPQAKAVIHAHPPTAIALSIAKPDWRELPKEALSELILSCGSIPIVPYARPGTLEMGTALLPYLPQSRLMILARHGALTWGETLEEAYFGMERLEHTCVILGKALSMGALSFLPEEEVHYLKQLRMKLGERVL